MLFKHRSVQLVVGESGLAELIRDLHWSQGPFGLASGIDIRVFAQSRGTFLVKLYPDQVKILTDKLPRVTLETQYGPREGEETLDD
jgi:hypothetical protein